VKEQLFRKCREHLAKLALEKGDIQLFPNGGKSRKSPFSLFVPGRIEVLGKHTDYCGGRSLICAADRGFCLVARPRGDRRIRIADAAAGESREFDFLPAISPPLGDWANYPMAVARRLASNFPGELRGADIAFASDLPPAAGMSSSSALVIACFLALSKVNDLPSRPEYRQNIHTPEELAGYIATHENGQTFGTLVGDKGVGTFGGSEDHTAILCCQTKSLSLYSYCPVRFERRIAMPEGYTFAIGSSGVVAEKTGAALAKYNRASLLAREAVKAWNLATGRQDPHLAAAIAGRPDAYDRILVAVREMNEPGFPWAQLVMRSEQFMLESTRIIPAACDALAAGDLVRFGHQVELSQQLADRLLGNQIDQTAFLARAARQCGAVASSAFGAGFGGAVWAMVKCGAAEQFLANWATLYHARFPDCAESSRFFQTQPGPAAFAL